MTEASGLDAANAIMASGNDVTKWSLSWNQIDVAGAKAIAEALKHENNKVERLNLGWNKIGVKGAKAIAEALKHENNKVEHLDMSSNKIRVAGAKAIAKALKHENNKVEHLNLGWNHIGVKGAKAIAEALLSVNCRVKNDLDLRGRIVENVIKDRRVFKNLLVLLSAREVRRIGTKAPMRKLPRDLIRLVAGMLPITRRDGKM